MRQLEDLKISGSQSKITEEGILRFESTIGFKLPSSYINFITKYNGGFPELDTYSNAHGEWDVNNFFYIDDGHFSDNNSTSTEGLLWNYWHKWEEAKESILPFAQDGGGNLFCLDLDFGEKSPVIFWNHENPESKGIIIANSFESFIDNLHTNPDYI